METWELTWTKLTVLDPDSISNIDDGIPGVYRLSYLNEDSHYYVFYVGQSENIKQRLSDYLSGNDDNVCIKNYIDSKKCYFRYAQVSEKEIRNAIERFIYKKYEPTCNNVLPEGKDIRVNLN